MRLTGVIVAIDEFQGWRVYSLDDSSGACIECSCAAPPSSPPAPDSLIGLSDRNAKDAAQKVSPDPDPNLPLASINVGTVVKIKGGVGVYREQKRIEIKRIQILGCTDEEVRCWDEVYAFLRDVVGQEWKVSEEEQKSCLRRWEREQRKDFKGRSGGKAAKGTLQGEKMQDGRRGQHSVGAVARPERTMGRQKEADPGGPERRGTERERERERIKNRHEYTEQERARRREKQRNKSGQGKGKEKEPETRGADKITIPAVAMSRIVGKYDALGL